MLNKIEAINEKLNRSLTSWICGICFVVIAYSMTFEALKRTILSTVTLGVSEVDEVLMTWLILIPLASALITGYHVRVTLVTIRLSGRARVASEVFADIVGVAFFFVLFYGAVPHFWKSFLMNEIMYAPADINVPLWFAKLSVVIGAFLILVTFLIRLIHTLHPTRVSGKEG